MNIEKVASAVLDELNQEMAQSQKNSIMLEGAMQGVRLLFQKLAEEAKVDNGKDIEPEPIKKAKKG